MKNLIKLLDLKEGKLVKREAAKDAIQPGEELKEFYRLLEQACLIGNEARTETDGFHPSALGIAAGACARRQVYILRGTKREGTTDPRAMRIFANGTGVHERLQRVLALIPGCEFDSEVVIKHDDPPISGHADGVLVLWNGHKILIEIKSINANGFEMRSKWKKEKAEHFDQANIYAYILDIDTLYFIYECKNDQQLLIFEAKADKAKAEKQLEKWRKTYADFEAGILPARPYKQSSKACSYCDLKDLCWSEVEQ